MNANVMIHQVDACCSCGEWYVGDGDVYDWVYGTCHSSIECRTMRAEEVHNGVIQSPRNGLMARNNKVESQFHRPPCSHWKLLHWFNAHIVLLWSHGLCSNYHLVCLRPNRIGGQSIWFNRWIYRGSSSSVELFRIEHHSDEIFSCKSAFFLC